MATRDDHSASTDTPTSDIVDRRRRDLHTVDRVLSLLGYSSLVETARDVLAVPPDQRRTDAVAIVVEEYSVSGLLEHPEEAAVPSGFDAAVPEASIELSELTQTLAVVVRRLRDAATEAVVDSRDADEESVVLVALFTVIGDLLDAFERRASADDEWRTYLSRLVVLVSHGVLVVAGERESTDDQLLTDLARVAAAETALDTNVRATDRTETTPAECVRTLGALVVYDRREISVARGAELADLSRDQFETALERHGIDVRTGPEATKALREEPTLSDATSE